jgi:hypothetical protein
MVTEKFNIQTVIKNIFEVAWIRKYNEGEETGKQ